MLNTPLWLDEPFTRGQAWVDLVGLANFKEGFIRIRGNRIEIKRGQVGWSIERLSSRWKWSRGKINRWLNELEIDKQIVQQKSRLTSVITIVNYEKYQSDGTTDGRQTIQQTDNRQYNRRVANKKVKKEKKVKKDDGKSFFGEFQNVLLTAEEKEKLSVYTSGREEEYIERLDGHIESKGVRYKNHYATIQNWYRRDNPKRNYKSMTLDEAKEVLRSGTDAEKERLTFDNPKLYLRAHG